MRRVLVGAVVAAAATAGFAVPAYAGGARSWLSGSGSDVGACEREAPCRTFGYAITQTSAGGEVVAIDSSGYGPVNITKSITLIAPRGVHAAITGKSGNAIEINAGPDDKVVIKNLFLNGKGATSGIVANTAGSIEVDDTTAVGFTNYGMLLGTGLPNSPIDVSVSDSLARDNGTAGLSFLGNGRPTMAIEVDHVRSARNGIYGIDVEFDVRGTVTDSIATRNGAVAGVFVAGTNTDPASLGLERVTATGNQVGLQAVNTGAKIIASNSTIEYNATGLLTVAGGQLVSRVNNTLTDNGTNGAFTSTILPAYRTR